MRKESLYSDYKRLVEIKKKLDIADKWFLEHEETDKNWNKADKRMKELIQEAALLTIKLT